MGAAVNDAAFPFIPTSATAFAATFFGAALSAFASANSATYFSTREFAPRGPSVANFAGSTRLATLPA